MNGLKSMAREDVAAWVHASWCANDVIQPEDTELADAVIALVEAKVFDAAMAMAQERMSLTPDICEGSPVPTDRELAERVVARVMGDNR